MTTKSLSLTALSCVLATAGAGCSTTVSQSSNQLEELLEQRLQSLSLEVEPDQKAVLRRSDARAEAVSAATQRIAQRRPESLPPQLSDPFSPERSGQEQHANQQRFWSEGIAAGYGASVAEQSAVTATDWNQVVTQWKTAIAQLSKITPNHPNYGDAQSKLAIYQTGLRRAEGNYIAVVQNRYAAANPAEAGASQPALKTRRGGNPSTQNLARENLSQGGFEQDGQQLRTWLETGNFAAVEQLLSEASRSRRRTRNGLDYADAVLVSAVAQKDVVFTTPLLERLNQWVSQSPRSRMAYAVRSYFTQAYLWQDMPLTLGQRPKKCPPTPEDLERLGISAADASIALSLDPKNPLALTSKLRLSKLGLFDQGGDSFEATFQALNAVAPHSFQAHLEKASYLWNRDKTGTGETALAFVRQAVAQAPSGSALPMLVPMMHINIANHQSNVRQYLSQPSIWQEIQTQSEQVIAQLPEAAPYSSLYADLANTTGRPELARRYQQIAINRSVSHPRGQELPKVMVTSQG